MLVSSYTVELIIFASSSLNRTHTAQPPLTICSLSSNTIFTAGTIAGARYDGGGAANGIAPGAKLRIRGRFRRSYIT